MFTLQIYPSLMVSHLETEAASFALSLLLSHTLFVILLTYPLHPEYSSSAKIARNIGSVISHEHLRRDCTPCSPGASSSSSSPTLLYLTSLREDISLRFQPIVCINRSRYRVYATPGIRNGGWRSEADVASDVYYMKIFSTRVLR